MIDAHILTWLTNTLPDVGPEVALQPISGGKNNRAYLLDTVKQKKFIKHYNKSLDKERSRLNAEYSFLTYANQIPCDYVTKPIASNEALGLGVYEYLPGTRFKKDDVQHKEISAALDFIQQLNLNRIQHNTSYLTDASESCFSLPEHINRVETRLARLHNIPTGTPIDQAAVAFVKEYLIPRWERIKNQILSYAAKHPDIQAVLSNNDRIISPSDFGFHNALRCANQIKFVDFEYAGWDDGAKLIGDFFSQIEIPITLQEADFFIHGISELVANPKSLRARAYLLLPLYRIKWICIVLNYFLPDRKNDKDFVAAVTDSDKVIQLEKANNILISIKETELLRDSNI